MNLNSTPLSNNFPAKKATVYTQLATSFHLTFLFALIFLIFHPAFAWAEDDTAPATFGQEEEKKRSFNTGTDFFDNASLNGSIVYFQRKRLRYDLNNRKMETNLNHATTQANMDFSSGFVANNIGLDFAAFGSLDLWSSGAPDHEMNFVPWSDPWHPDWSKQKTKDNASIYKAALKLKGGPAWAKAGLFQPSGPGVLGVNWSIFPGTYRGAEMGADFGGLSLSAAWADEYKAPWYYELYSFRKRDGETKVDYLWSMGARYTFENELSLELAYGESEDYLKNAHFKLNKTQTLGELQKLNYGYTLYTMADNDNSGSLNDNFDGVAYQHYVHAKFETGPWTLKGEFTYTWAPANNQEQLGYFAYRLVNPNGGAKGAYDIWWDARSDWNHHKEKAIFAGVSRTLDDILPLAGFSAGISGAIGWDGKAYGYSQRLREQAWNLDLGYTMPDGFFKGSSAFIHFTEYNNSSSLQSWEGFKNAFQDERDIKILVSIPFSI